MSRNSKSDSQDVKSEAILNGIERIWNAQRVIAERLGMSLDNEGKYFMESDNATVPRMSQQSGGGAGPSVAQQPTMDVGTFATEVLEKFKEDPPPVDLGKQCVAIDAMSIVLNNEKLFRLITKPWQEQHDRDRKDILKIFGYKEIKVGNNTVLAVDDDSIITRNSYIECDNTTEKEKKSLKDYSIRATLVACSRRLWQDMISTFWKGFAYSLAMVSVIFCGYMWWNVAREEELLSKKLDIIETVLNTDSGGQQMLKDIDNHIKRDGIDKVREVYHKEAEKLRLQRFRESKK